MALATDTPETIAARNARQHVKRQNAGKHEAYTYGIVVGMAKQDRFSVEAFCIDRARTADNEITDLTSKLSEANEEIARLTRELEFARAANRKHVRDLTDAQEENNKLRSGGLAVAL